MTNYSMYVGLDVHKDWINVAVALRGRKSPVSRGEISNTPKAVEQMIKRVVGKRKSVGFCYEAGPCGYELYRQIHNLGYDCIVVAPSLIPKKPGDRIKTDSRDACELARLYRSGDLTTVWVPDKSQEAIRDLTRAREDMKSMVQHARQRLNAFMLRHNRGFPGKSRWGPSHFKWLEQQKFEIPEQQIVFQEYVDTVQQAQLRVSGLKEQLEQSVKNWSMEPVIRALMALRGVDLITAATIIAELGDLTRFESPRQLMNYLGLVPSEHSSGAKKRYGGITKTGNCHVRRILIESAWCYRFPARKTAHIQRRAKQTTQSVQQIAWKAQKRLCARYRHLVIKRGKLQVQATTAVARELVGFIWAIAKEIQPSIQSKNEYAKVVE